MKIKVNKSGIIKMSAQNKKDSDNLKAFLEALAGVGQESTKTSAIKNQS